MSTIYAVTSGCYSAYSITGIFSTKEKAEQWMKVCGCAGKDDDGYGSRIEEYELDQGLAEMDRGLLLFGVEIRKNGDVLKVTEGGYPNITGPITSWSTYNGFHDSAPARTTVYVWANDREHAIKVANERRIQALAENVPTYGPAVSEEASQ